MLSHPNNRTCLADEIYALLSHKEKAPVFSDICLGMPATGDTSIRCANNALAKHGMEPKRASSAYNQREGTPYHLLKDRQYNLIINIKLGDLHHGTGFSSHFVAWDGKTIWDHPDSVRVNFTSNHATLNICNLVFKKLYHMRCSSWQITNVYQLVRQIQQGEPLPTTAPGRRRYKRGLHAVLLPRRHTAILKARLSLKEMSTTPFLTLVNYPMG